VQKFIPGQRWISNAELQMGLGTVLTVDHRSVTIVFLATGETRTYAQDTAPLTRVNFGPGDTATSHEGWTMKVLRVEEHKGLLVYHGMRDNGSAATLEEGQLDNFIQLNRPTDRLFSGQIDSTKWFDLRYETLKRLTQLSESALLGLSGARTSLIPHQLYIAHEVASRYAPRVLLADEVGLGKTIEAGMILHRQLITEHAKRVLILVPESLCHQWLVEMRRRFNLRFSLFNEERCMAAEESNDNDNPFHTEQLVLCSMEFFLDNPPRIKQALAGNWDLLIVDEAHHLHWSPEEPSFEYQIVERLAQQTKGVLLLTATPEQLGKAGHFARLRLLDPARFPDFDKFVAEEQAYEPVAQAVEQLLSNEPSREALATLQQTLGDEGDNQAYFDVLQDPQADDLERKQASKKLVEHLLDRHGTGRVLYRNTRSAVKGFPGREVHSYPLPLPAAYADYLAEFQHTALSEPRLLLCPELLYQAVDKPDQPHWSQLDPRVNWLTGKLSELKPKKVLVITASADTALDLADVLRTKTGIHAAVFHEGMSIIERDRAAAFFADQEYGTQVLICSEIGSEGRNFQFAHHLVLFDLPLNPDLLEQRIGRLDRIGQTRTINIHVPYLQNSAQAIMQRWYHDGLNAFQQTCPAGHSVFQQVKDSLVEALHQLDEGLDDLDALIATTTLLHNQLNEALQKGRDRLLEYNSCRPEVAAQLVALCKQQDINPDLEEYLETVFDCYGVDTEPHSSQAQILRPNEYMQSAFPELDEDGMTITYDRVTALANEDMHFITWEHPLVAGVIDMVSTQEQGNTALTAIKRAGLAPGTLLIEALYCLDPAPSPELQSSKYLPQRFVRVLMDQNGREHSANISVDDISFNAIAVDKDTARKIVRSQIEPLRALIARTEKVAEKHSTALISEASHKATETFQTELDRLQALRQVNPNVRDDEVQFFQHQLHAIRQSMDSAKLRLDALRVVIAT